MADRSLDVVGIGNAIVDVLAKTDEAFLAKHGLSKGVMSLIDAEQAPSVALHRSMGFDQVAFLKEVGFKFGRRLHVIYMQRMV